MTTENQHISVYEGEDKTIKISVTDTSGGSAVDLSGASEITWSVTSGATSGTAIITKTKTGGEITLANDAGTSDQIVIALDAADTQGQEGNSLYHECRVLDAASKSHVVAVGGFSVRHSATG